MSRKQRIQQILEKQLNPVLLTIDDFSHEHNVPASGESHITIRIVSDAFVGKSSVQRHRMVYAALRTELQGGLHALQLQTLTPDSVDQKELTAPRCKGGEK